LPQGMLSVHFLLAGQKKVNMGFLFLIVEKESKMVFPLLFLKTKREKISQGWNRKKESKWQK